jgi:hypothetical protein
MLRVESVIGIPLLISDSAAGSSPPEDLPSLQFVFLVRDDQWRMPQHQQRLLLLHRLPAYCLEPSSRLR